MSKQKDLKIFAVIMIVFYAVFSLNIVAQAVLISKTISNYNHNVVAWKEYNYDGIINDQHDFANLRFGFGNISDNGCGAVAVYNILKLEGQNPYFPDIIREFDMFGQNAFGLGGAKPRKVFSVLRDYGFSVKFTFDHGEFESYAQNSKYAIFLYYGMENNVPFGHYQLMYNFDGAKFQTINITGTYTFDDITNISNTIISIMIGIN